MENKIKFPAVKFFKDSLKGEPVEKSFRKLSDLENIFQDKEAYNVMDKDQTVYEVSSYLPVEEGTVGGLFFGISYVYPGKVGNEYFMTKGHFHSKIDTAEFYWCIDGEGVLIMMDEHRNVWGEKMLPGSLHYIKGRVAHRLANTGSKILSVGACWPSDAGHNYEEIAKNGFSCRLIDVENNPVFVNNNEFLRNDLKLK